jgi:transposase
MEECIDFQPDIIIAELREKLKRVRGVTVSVATIYRTLKRQGWNYDFVRIRSAYAAPS